MVFCLLEARILHYKYKNGGIKMKRKLFAKYMSLALTAAMSVSLFAGCTQKEPAPAPTTPANSGEQKTDSSSTDQKAEVQNPGGASLGNGYITNYI